MNMQENAVMIQQGLLCACGAQLDGPAHGCPRYCSKECAKLYDPRAKPHKVRCPECGKSVKREGLKNHVNEKHVLVPADTKSLNSLVEKFND